VSKHEEFPELTEEAKEILTAAYRAAFPLHNGYKIEWTEVNRISTAALLREAIEKVYDGRFWTQSIPYRRMQAIASNLHNPPRPPTLDQAREAARQLGGENAAIVHAFLATLGEGEQP